MGEPDGERGAGDDRPGDGRGQGGVANSAVGKGDDLMRERVDVQFAPKMSLSLMFVLVTSTTFLDEQ